MRYLLLENNKQFDNVISFNWAKDVDSWLLLHGYLPLNESTTVYRNMNDSNLIAFKVGPCDKTYFELQGD